jgi:FkbM family methyltransferase
METPTLNSHIARRGTVLGRYRAAFRNYPLVLLRIFLHLFPIKAKLRNGKSWLLQDRLQSYYASMYAQVGWNLDTLTDKATFPWPGHQEQLTFEGAGHDGDLVGVFAALDWDSLEVHGKVVVDVGANIGDSAVYFCLRGAERVISLEPFPQTRRLAIANVRHNGFQSRVLTVNAACGAVDGSISVDPSKRSNVSSSLAAHPGSVEVPRISLSTLVKHFTLSRAVLKMDCEGCEYESILSADSDVLRQFDQIAIEFHRGYAPLVSKLRGAGFDVAVRSLDSRQEVSENSRIQTGYVLASLRPKQPN